jgi:hypothetical protein
MNQHMLPALAKVHSAELRAAAAGSRRRRDRGRRLARPSLRERTGWTLVDLGLRLAAQPAPRLVRQPRTVGSC